MSNTNKDKEYLTLYNFWKDVPTIKYVDPEIYPVINQDVRSTILDVMRKGVSTELSNNKDLPGKRAFSAQELLEIVNDELSTEVKLSNIYFHLDKLMEEKLVEQITVIQEGRHKTKYFGRTAKVFIFQSETIKDEAKNNIIASLSDLILELHPEKTEDEMNELFNRALNYEKIIQDKYAEWVIKHQDTLIKLDLDFLSLYSFFSDMYKSTDSDYNNLSEDIRHLLDLPEDAE